MAFSLERSICADIRASPLARGVTHLYVAVMRCDRIWRNARLATMAPGRVGLGLIEDGLVACREGRIVYAGSLESAPPSLDALEVVDCQRRWITPGLIDCHTHLVYAGDRAHEFEQRLNGVSYEAIARAGGGILSTVKATRAASEAELIAASLPRLDALLAEGRRRVGRGCHVRWPVRGCPRCRGRPRRGRRVSGCLVRVLVPYSRTLYFNDKGAQRGLVADALKDFEVYLNRHHKLKTRPITVVRGSPGV